MGRVSATPIAGGKAHRVAVAAAVLFVAFEAEPGLARPGGSDAGRQTTLSHRRPKWREA